MSSLKECCKEYDFLSSFDFDTYLCNLTLEGLMSVSLLSGGVGIDGLPGHPGETVCTEGKDKIQ